MKIFQKIQMASEDVKSLLKTGVYYASGNPAQIHDGAVVVVGDPLDHELYASMKDLNNRKLTAPVATTDKMVGFVDYVGVSQANVMDVTYRIGDKTAGVMPVVGEPVRVRIPMIGDEFWLGADNFTEGDAAVAVGKYAVAKANDTVLEVKNDAPETEGICVKVEDVKDLVLGQINDSKMYRCRVVAL